MKQLTIADVLSYHEATDSPPLSPRYFYFLRQLSSFVEPSTPVELVDIDRVYGGKISHPTMLAYRSVWKRCVNQAFPGAAVMRYSRKRKGSKRHMKVNPELQTETWKGKRMDIPIPLPERGIIVHIDAPMDLTDADAEKIRNVLLAYAV